MSKYAAKVMLPQKKGKIVNISCIRSTIFRGNMADYAASKGAIVSLTSAMALDLAPFNIQVNAVAPGFIYTGMTEKSFDAKRNINTDGKTINNLGMGVRPAIWIRVE